MFTVVHFTSLTQKNDPKKGRPKQWLTGQSSEELNLQRPSLSSTNLNLINKQTFAIHISINSFFPLKINGRN